MHKPDAIKEVSKVEKMRRIRVFSYVGGGWTEMWVVVLSDDATVGDALKAAGIGDACIKALGS